MKRSKTVTLSASFTTLAATLATTAACATPEQSLYCADEHRYIVEATECERDDSSSPYFIYYGHWGGYNYSPGAQLKQNGLTGRVKASDPAARSSAGLPARGDFGGNGAKLTSSGG